jgi:phage baseplate assembly protein gpV
MPAGDSFRLTSTGSLQFINAAQQITGTAGELLLTATSVRTSAELEIDGDLNHDGSNIGFFGVAPAARAAAYTVSNLTTDRTYDCNATTVNELADVLGTLIADLTTYGLLQ